MSSWKGGVITRSFAPAPSTFRFRFCIPCWNRPNRSVSNGS